MAPKQVCDDIAWDWKLPPQPYVPASGMGRPDDDDVIHRIARFAPDPTDPESWADNPAWLAGLRLYDEGYFWEAHEVLEPVWMKARPNSLERVLAQGIIQLANAALKQKMGRQAAAVRLADEAARKICDAGLRQSSLMGLDMVKLYEAVAGYCQQLSESPSAAAPPRLSTTRASGDS